MNELEPSRGGSEGARLPAPQTITPTSLTLEAASVAHSESQGAIEALPAYQAQAEPQNAAARATSELSAPFPEPENQEPLMPLVEGLPIPCSGSARVSTRRITIAFNGTCKGNPGRGGYGAILVNACTGTERIVKGRDASTTNNQMELTAAIAGLNALRPGAVFIMLRDSQYFIGGMTEWLPGWKAKGWKAAGGKPAAKKEIWQSLEMTVARHESVTWGEGARGARVEREGRQDRERGG